MPFADPDDDVLEALRALGAHDVSVDASRRVRARAHAALASGRRRAGTGRARFRAAYDRVLEPALLTALLATQLAWAAHRTLLLL